MTLTFTKDLRPLFTDEDVECMGPMAVPLDDPAWMCVLANAESVYGVLADGSMPPGNPWPADHVALFKAWIDAGCPA